MRRRCAPSSSRASRLKAARRDAEAPRPLAGKTLAMIFDSPSTRTRVSFDVGMRELGGETLLLTGQEMQLGRGETIADTARVLSRYVDAIMIRALDAAMVAELAANATIPVINGLTKLTHPCQVHGRHPHLRGAQGADRRPHDRLDGRRQQRARLLGPCRCALRLHASPSPRRRSLRRSRRCSPGRRRTAPTSASRPRPRSRRAAPTASSPTPGCPWATRSASAATISSSPIRSTAL